MGLQAATGCRGGEGVDYPSPSFLPPGPSPAPSSFSISVHQCLVVVTSGHSRAAQRSQKPSAEMNGLTGRTCTAISQQKLHFCQFQEKQARHRISSTDTFRTEAATAAATMVPTHTHTHTH
ncbi:hypothetical protein JOB18_032262 [Solea senegalensis]|uniref:Uncharacterized protein n=1 Tax=Solea senegalensis TaxID=28829 RepID=A0AAV6PT61_SOLSE|nr:hypothetical protein JOB18_032262 [Solea senegalensis]